MTAKEQVLNVLNDPKLYMEKLVCIKTKDSQIKKLVLNPMQLKLHNIMQTKRDNYGSIKVIVLKARQHGISTYESGYGFWDIATHKNRTFAIVTQEEKATKNLFERMKLIKDHLPEAFRPTEKYSNAKELVFQSTDTENSMNSSVKCYTAGSSEIGRSETINHLHISEYAFWNPTFAIDNFSAIMQAVPKENSTVLIESTPNGYNHFKDLWDSAVSGENDFIPVFMAWFENPDYSIDGVLDNKTEEEIRIQNLYSLSDSQLIWRRWCINNNCNKDINKFHQEYPACPEEAFINSGTAIFNNDLIVKRIETLTKQYKENPPDVGSFAFREFKKGINNYVRIYEYPNKSHEYVIGLDTAGDGSDNYGATVIDNATGKRVATMWVKILANEVVDQVEALGYFYNTALISVEVNFNLYPIEELTRRNYPKQYVRKTYDNYTGRFKNTYGWKTDGNTRPLMITAEQILINEHIELFTDLDMLKEALTFVRDDKGRPDAIAGKHDDMLFGDMIASQAREQQSINVPIEKEKEKVKIHPSLQNDYDNASEREKQEMREYYGDIF